MSASRHIRIARSLPLDPAHGLLPGTLWKPCDPPPGGDAGTWITSATGAKVRLHRHEWEEAETALQSCPACGGAAHVVPAVKRGLYIAECIAKGDCNTYPMTSPFPSEVEAADAWNRSEFARDSHSQIAASE
jgi:hypothetical protein